MTNIKLFGSFTSPYVRHCRIALLEADADYQFVETDAAASAELSPMKKVPFLSYEDNGETIHLTDSSTILKWIREKSGAVFMPDLDKFNQYCAANTLLDTAINLFYLEMDGVTGEQSKYLKRQQARLDSGLAELDRQDYATEEPFGDHALRIACLLDWGLYRQRFSIDSYSNLQKLLKDIRQHNHFANTAPPAA